MDSVRGRGTTTFLDLRKTNKRLTERDVHMLDDEPPEPKSRRLAHEPTAAMPAPFNGPMLAPVPSSDSPNVLPTAAEWTGLSTNALLPMAAEAPGSLPTTTLLPTAVPSLGRSRSPPPRPMPVIPEPAPANEASGETAHYCDGLPRSAASLPSAWTVSPDGHLDLGPTSDQWEWTGRSFTRRHYLARNSLFDPRS